MPLVRGGCVSRFDGARGLGTCAWNVNEWTGGYGGTNGPPHPDELTTLPDPDDQTYNPQNSFPWNHQSNPDSVTVRIPKLANGKT